MAPTTSMSFTAAVIFLLASESHTFVLNNNMKQRSRISLHMDNTKLNDNDDFFNPEPENTISKGNFYIFIVLISLTRDVMFLSLMKSFSFNLQVFFQQDHQT